MRHEFESIGVGMHRMRMKIILAMAVALSLLSTTVQAQDAQRVAPKVLPANPPTQLRTPPPASRPSEETQIVGDLKGLVFVDSQSKLRDSSTMQGIDLSQVPILDRSDFRGEMSAYLGKPLTMAGMNEICQRVVKYCKSVDRPVVDVIVPQQDVTDGTIQILVLQGRVGQVRAEGNRFFPSQMLINDISAKPGDTISQSQLLDDVDWMNRNPFRRTDVILEPGAAVGQTDIVLHTEDHFPLRAYAGYENTGPVSTGEDRWLAGFNWGNAFDLDDQLNYQYTIGDTSQHFQAHSGSYVAPLPWRHILTFFGNWSSSDVQVDPNVFQHGEDWQLSTRYEIPLPRFHGIGNSFVLGGDFKRSNTNADFGGSSVFASDVSVAQFMLGYNVNDTDRFGSTDAALEWYISPGHIGPNDSTASYQIARVGADAEYNYWRLTADRTTNLPAQFSWVTRFQGQLGSSALIGSEQLGVGGLDSVRGYEEREGNGDSGVIFSNELHAPPISFFHVAGRSDQLGFFGFIDYGEAWQRDAQPGQNGRENFLGAGPGVNYQIGPWLSVQYAYGWRMAAGDPTVNETGRSHLRVVASFTY
jgi:hemolysin activation/secretion protein